ncbi:hypothetical protein GCM10011391_27980 [Pullulanibacillus camelliae]|uniref:Tape measure protein N-terminal domain-containing protein n=1 Tax=Pullulanibacillus camelliae TaxID=1707096 RepID=A0A8J2YJG4_9BACL|nr:tape measure protein [Pullulanibacillus camelliae]GGE47574.1 hypothetical protein GCM10011391_27980 [Pullulanibacillus camelliae]
MSDGKVVIDVDLNDGNVDKGVENVNRQLSGIRTNGEQASLSLGKLVSTLGLIELARKGIDLVKESLSSAFNRIDTMERFNRVMTTITGSSKIANDVLDQTNSIVKGTAYGLDVAAKSVQNFVTRGVNTKKATGYVKAFADAVAFYGDGSNEQFENVSDALSKMVTAGKVGMDQLDRLFDAGIDAVGMYAKATGRNAADVQKDLSNGKISAKQFIDTVSDAMENGTGGVQKIAGAAKEAGASWNGTFDNMKAAVARGVTDIIDSIDNLLKDNGLPDMRTMIADFGKNFELTLQKAANSLPKIINKIKSVYDTLSPWIPLIKTVVAVVGTFVLSLATLNTGIKAVTVTMNILQKVLELNPYTAIAAAAITAIVLIIKYWGPISGFFSKLWDSIKTTFFNVWNGIIDFFTGIINSIKNTFHAFIEGYQNGFVAMQTKTETVAAFIGNIIYNLVSGFKAAISGFVNFWASVWDGMVNITTTVVNTVIAVFTPIVAFFASIWTNIQTAAMAAWDIIKNVILGSVLLLIDLVTGNITDFKSHLSQIWNNIKSDAQAIWTAFKNVVLSIIKAYVKAVKLEFKLFVTAVKAVWNAIKTAAVATWNAIKSAVIAIIKGFVNTAKSIFNGLKNAIKSIWNAIKSVTSSIWNGIKNTVINLASGIKNGLIKAWNTIKSATSKAFKSVVNFIKNPLKSINLLSIGKNIIKGLINGIGSMKKAVEQKIKDVAGGVKSKIMSILGIHSPSRWMRDMIGKNMMLGWQKGIDDQRTATIKKAGQATDWMKPDVPIVSGFINKMRGMTAPVGNVMPISFAANNGAAVINSSPKNTSGAIVVQLPDGIRVNIAGHEASGLIDFITEKQEKKKIRVERFDG